MLTLLANTQPSAPVRVTDIGADVYLVALIVGGIVVAALAWFIIKGAVLAALRRHAQDRKVP